MKKKTLSIISFILVMAIMAGCGKISANANERPDNTEATETVAAAPQDQAEEQKAEEAGNSETENESIPDVKISRWRIEDKEDDEGNCINFLEHQTGPDRFEDVEEVYDFDPDSGIEAYHTYIYDYNEEETLFLLYQEGCFYVLNIETEELQKIIDGCLDKHLEDGMIFYTDLDYTEYSVNWLESEESVPTGKSVISYTAISNELYGFEPKVNEDFVERFKEIQEFAKNGGDVYTIKDLDVYYDGDIYDLNHNYMGNFHFEKPYAWNSNLFFDCYDMEATMFGNTLTFYYYGNIVREYHLPDGEWKVLECYFRFHEDPNTSFVKYIIDVNNDGVTTPEEIDEAITNTNILLYNFSDKSVYTINQNGIISKVAEKVVDFQEAYGEFYWMDENHNAYELSWTKTIDSILIGENVVGISKHTDERAGFVVKPGDPRANHKSDGLDLCTLYGDDWLNQDKTSGAWALEYDWE